MPKLLSTPPLVEFRPLMTLCPDCGGELKVSKTRIRTVSTLHVGRFQAREVFLSCQSCGHTHRSEELNALVPPGANFGYDVMVEAGTALLLRHRNEEEVVAQLAQRNVRISPREVSLLSMKFVVHLPLPISGAPRIWLPICRLAAGTSVTWMPHAKGAIRY